MSSVGAGSKTEAERLNETKDHDIGQILTNGCGPCLPSRPPCPRAFSRCPVFGQPRVKSCPSECEGKLCNGLPRGDDFFSVGNVLLSTIDMQPSATVFLRELTITQGWIFDNRCRRMRSSKLHRLSSLHFRRLPLTP